MIHAAPQFRVIHHMVCRHQVEVMVQPPRAQLYFQNERWIDPIDAQLRFEAVVYNANSSVSWEVFAPNGGTGHGTIDQTGLYTAPDKGALPSGTTDVVVATARADPLRKAFAWVTLVGLGPLPAPVAGIEIWPKRATLYYQSFLDNRHIDDSNKRQIFRAFPANEPDPRVRWLVNGAVHPGTDPWFTYIAPNGGGVTEVTVIAQLLANAAVQDDAKVTLLNYQWPGF